MSDNQVVIDREKMEKIIIMSYNQIKKGEQEKETKSQIISKIIEIMKKELEKDAY